MTRIGYAILIGLAILAFSWTAHVTAGGEQADRAIWCALDFC
jgi:hypothetical protein